ncbi:MAG: Rne/Rng family ribonuclease [Myxococcota bacterium]|nr:Rne/Rng family ribonuclease [Myxococcota bacterium]
MQNEIIVNAESGETRVALLERSQFTEFHIERTATKDVVGNVVKARVMRVLPGMQAAFVDIGLEKAGFLYVGDYFAEPKAGNADGNGNGKSNGRGRGGGRGPGGRGRGPRRAPPPIDSVLSEGQEIIVQIAKEPIGTKGARITSHVSIAGRHLVLTPWSPRVGVSRRIDSDKERRRLREIVERYRPKDLGFIIRTAGDGLKESDLEADIKYLTTVWNEIQEKKVGAVSPAVLYSEPDLPLRVLRDFANSDTQKIVIDNKEIHQNLVDFSKRFVSDPQPKIALYEGREPVFDHFELEQQIHANLERKVRLKSGGSIVIDQGEALTAIDVNSGRYVGKRDLEETVFRTNLEAVKEVVHQLRFRNIGGLIIIDLIDMESRDNRDKVYRALQDAIRSDKAKTNILKISELGLVEMTRKRTRENLVQALCEPCTHCEGRGYVLSAESVAFKVLREIRKDLPVFCGRQIAITVSPQVASQLLGPEAGALATLSEELGREVEVRARPGLHQEQFELSALDQGPPVEISLSWLGEKKSEEDESEPSESLAVGGDAIQEAAEAVIAETVPAAEATDGAEAPQPPTPAESAPEAVSETLPTPEATEPAVSSDLAQDPAPQEISAAAEPLTSPAATLAKPGNESTDAPQALDAAADSRILPGSLKAPSTDSNGDS